MHIIFTQSVPQFSTPFRRVLLKNRRLVKVNLEVSSQLEFSLKINCGLTVLKNEFFSHLEVQNVLKIHAKILSLNIFKKFKIFILPLAGVRQYHNKIIQKSRFDPQELLFFGFFLQLTLVDFTVIKRSKLMKLAHFCFSRDNPYRGLAECQNIYFLSF